MCRLLGMVSNTHDRLPEQLRADLTGFAQLSDHHCDGWGIAYWNTQDDLVCEKAPEPAMRSSAFTAAVTAARTDAALLHLRKASPKMANTPANTHPFVAGSVAFAHNGYLSPLSELDELVAEAGGRPSTGGTDSERYFHLVLAELRQHGPVEALHRAATLIADRAEALSLNCLLLTHDALYASARYDEKVIAAANGDVASFELRYRISAGQVVVASVGWAQPEPWRPLGNGQILQVDRADLRTTVHTLH
jgi:predicted glutamine amidotransferase